MTSFTLFNGSHSPALPAGIHHISDIMRHVLARHGLSLEQGPNPVPPVKATGTSGLFDAAISRLESTLAG